MDGYSYIVPTEADIPYEYEATIDAFRRWNYGAVGGMKAVIAGRYTVSLQYYESIKKVQKQCNLTQLWLSAQRRLSNSDTKTKVYNESCTYPTQGMCNFYNRFKFISFSIIHLICFSFKHLSPESTVNQLLLCKGEGYKAQ